MTAVEDRGRTNKCVSQDRADPVLSSLPALPRLNVSLLSNTYINWDLAYTYAQFLSSSSTRRISPGSQDPQAQCLLIL